jgi:hypothetical protein
MSFKNPPMILAAVLVALLVSIPTAAGFFLAPRGTSWTGINSRNTADLNCYLSMVEEIRHDGWKARNLFTAEPHAPFQIRPVHILMGLTGKLIPRVDSVVIFSSAQIIFAIGLVLILAVISVRLFQENQDQTTAFLILCLGSGLGWTHLVPDPPDLRIVETSTFLTLLSAAIFTVVISLILGIIMLQWKAWEEKNLRRAVCLSLLPGLFALWLGLERPFSLANLFAGLGGALLFQGIRLRRFSLRAVALAGPFCLGSIVALFYQFKLLRELPLFAEWGRQNILTTPEWPRLLMSFGLLIPFAFFGFRPIFSRFPVLGSIIVGYILGSLIFSRLPIPFQERLLEGTPVILSIPASFGVVRLKNHFRRTAFQRVFLIAVILILAPSGFVGLMNDIKAFEHGAPPQYLPNSFLDAMRSLNRMVKPHEAIFCSHASGNFIPSYSGRTVVIGHSIQTAQFLEKWKMVMQFFQLSSDDPRSLQILKKTRASWVFWGPEEVWLARGGFDPDHSPYLRLEFSGASVKIYRVK